MRTPCHRFITHWTPVTFSTFLAVTAVAVALASAPARGAIETIADAGKARCAILTADQSAFMEQRAAAELARVIARDTGAKVDTKPWSQFKDVPAEQRILLVGTPASVPLIAALSQELPDGIGDVPLMGPDGYAVQSIERDGRKFLVIAGATPRAAYYGAVYAGEQVIVPPAGGKASGKESLAIDSDVKISRAPAMAVRAPYTLGFTGIQPQYTVADWKVILDGMAREGDNRVYFWWQSLHKPKSFPDRRNVDGGNDRARMTDADVNELAKYAHQLGMKFLLGGGAFSWGGASALTDVYPETAAKGVGGMCPSNPKAREVQTAFTLEMFESVPDADGIWFEPRDEHGECKCDVCQRPVDSLGSKQYGQSEISWFKDFAKRLWAKHPRAELAWLVEVYPPSKMHSEDPAYFAKIAQIKDPRIQWIVVWGAWDFPGPDGQYRPNTFVSRQNIWWNKPYASSLDVIRTDLLKAADRGMLGTSPAFEMCFSVDYYGGSIPYPMDALPYELTSYAFREFSWEPAQTIDAFKAKMLRRYFGPGALPELVDDLIYLRQFAIEGGWASNRSLMLTSMAGEFVSYDGKRVPRQDPAATIKAALGYSPADRKMTLDRLEKRLTDLRDIQAKDLPRMKAIEDRLNELEPTATRRAKASFALIRRFITDTRKLIDEINLSSAQVEQSLKDVAAARQTKGS